MRAHIFNIHTHLLIILRHLPVSVCPFPSIRNGAIRDDLCLQERATSEYVYLRRIDSRGKEDCLPLMNYSFRTIELMSH